MVVTVSSPGAPGPLNTFIAACWQKFLSTEQTSNIYTRFELWAKYLTIQFTKYSATCKVKLDGWEYEITFATDSDYTYFLLAHNDSRRN